MAEQPTLDQRPLGVGGSKVLQPEQFGLTLGLASWLMSMSKEHRDRPISSLEADILPAILLKQFKLYYKDKMPIAFLSWAMVSAEVKARLETGRGKIFVHEWRSGPTLTVIDCVSPFALKSEIIDQFLASVHGSQRGAQ